METSKKILMIVAALSLLTIASCAALGFGTVAAVNVISGKPQKSADTLRAEENAVHNARVNAEVATEDPAGPGEETEAAVEAETEL